MDDVLTERIKRSMAAEKERKGPPEGFPAFPPLPAARYTDPDFLALEEKHLWKKSWLYACHMDEIPEVGSYMLWKRSGSPILIVRGKDNEPRAFYNTCRHRGAPVVADESGQSRAFMCSYHGWTYNLEGDLINLRDKRDFPDLDKSCKGLVKVRCERWGNWIFVNEDEGAASLQKSIGPIWDEMAEFCPQDLRFVDRAAFEVPCNVKILLDAFLETYHLKSIHQNTVDRFLDHMGTTITLWKNGNSRMVTPNRREDWVDPGTIGMPKIDGLSEIPRLNNVSYNIYPNIVMPPSDSGIPMLVFFPKTNDSMVVECHWFSPDWGDGEKSDLWSKRIENFERILEEDTQFAPTIQKSVESPGCQGMTLSYQERRIYHWHEELDRRIGDEIPAEAALKPLLEPYIDVEGLID